MDDAQRFHKLVGSGGADADLKAGSIRGGASLMVAEVIESVLRLVMIGLLARLLVPEHFGLVSMVTAITAVAERFKDLGLGIATVQRKEISHELVSTLFWINAGLGVAMVLLVSALALPIAHFYEEPRLLFITLAIASSFFWSGLTIQHQALLRRKMKYGQLALVQVSASALSIVVAVAVALLDYGYWALVARDVSCNIFRALGTWLCLPWVPGAPRRTKGVGAMLMFGGDVTAFSLVWFVSANVDQILLGKFAGATPLGFYRQAVALVVGPINQITSPVHFVAESALSRLQGDPEKYRHFFRGFLGALAFITMPAAAFVIVFADEIVLVVLGARWVDVAHILRILAVVAFVKPVYSTGGLVMVTCGRSRRFFWWGLISSLWLVACLAAGVGWGPTGVAWAHVVSTYFLLIPGLLWSVRDTPVALADFAASIYRPFVASILMAIILYAVRYFSIALGPLGLLLIGVVLAVPTYLGPWFVIPGGRRELSHTLENLLSVVRPAGLSDGSTGSGIVVGETTDKKG